MDNLRNLDLNLLMVLDAVVSEKSMTSAARKLGMTQPAVSRAMARLHASVGYELIKRTGHGVEPTRQAYDLVEQVRPALEALRTALMQPGTFDPSTSRQEFILDIAGGIEATFLVPLVRRLAEAPHVRVRVTYGYARAVTTELKLGQCSLSLDLEEVSADGYRSELLYESHAVVVSRRDHPRIDGRLTAQTYAALDHVGLVWAATMKGNSLDPHLARYGIVRRTPVVVPTIAALALVCEGSDLVGTVSARTARMIAGRYALDVHPMPLNVPPIRIVTTWHRSFDDDAGHQWLRRTLKEIVAEQGRTGGA